MRRRSWRDALAGSCEYRRSPVRSEAHLRAPKIRQILHNGASLEVNFEVHRREVRSRTSLEKRVPLFRQVGAILRAVGRGPDVHDTRVLTARVLVADGMADVR